MRGGLCIRVLWLAVLLAPAWSIAAPPVEKIAEAKRHYQRGTAAYAKDDFNVALREFKRAFELSQRPEILFNLARVETKLGHDAEAIAYLEHYLALKPDAEDVPAVQAEIDAHRKALAAQRGEQQARQGEQAARDEAARARREEEATRARAIGVTRFGLHGRAGIALTAVGGAVLVVGISLGVVALQAAASVERGAGMPVPFAGSSFASQDSTGRTVAPLGIAFDVLGAAAVATGVGLLVWRRVVTDREARVSLVPMPGGLAVAGAF